MTRSPTQPSSAVFSLAWLGADAAGAAWRALLAFALLFVLPRALAGREFALLEVLALLLTYGLVALAIFRFLQRRGERTPTPEAATLLADDAAHPGLTDTVLEAGTPLRAEDRPRNWSLELLHALEWKRMADLCLAFYAARGLRGEIVATGADGSVDAHLFQAGGAAPFALLHCKARGQRTEDVDAVQALLAQMQTRGVGKAFFMGARGFSEAARELAKASQVQLVDDRMFLAMLLRLAPDEGERLLKLATDGDYRTPSCPACGLKMLARANEQGRYWGCRAYPRCKAALGMATEAQHG